MSDFEKQYDSPETKIVPEQNPIAGNLTETMLQHLKGASPWTRFIGIVGFINCGILALTGLVLLILAITTNSLTNELLEEVAGAPSWAGSLLNVTAGLGSFFYIAMGAVIFFPSRFLYKFGSFIQKYQFSNSDEDLEQALSNNKSFWKFCGILTIISLALIPVILIAAFIIGIAAAGLFY